MSTNTSTNGSVDSNTSGTTMIQLGDHELLLLERQKTYMLEE
jgi:hypothetical protein